MQTVDMSFPQSKRNQQISRVPGEVNTLRTIVEELDDFDGVYSGTSNIRDLDTLVNMVQDL